MWIEQLRQDWAAGSSDRVAKSVFERVDGRRLGTALATAARGLSSKAKWLNLEPELLDIVSDERRWPQGCNTFQTIRSKTLEAERAGGSGAYEEALLLFQENVAKHLCNESSNLKRYDDDSGKWAVFCLAELLKYVDSEIADPLCDAFISDVAK